ncbi:MAG: hypothetical protein GX434_00350 [Peptococcaceae bacterium]|nr:hypothetical protein [Peptococcaceae bacterium]
MISGCTDAAKVKPKESEGRPLKVVESSFDSIDSLLKERDIELISWSPDRSAVAFSSGKQMDQQLYLWQPGKTEPVELAKVKDRICELIWSPDNRYVVADAGTSISRSSYVIDATDSHLLDCIVNIGAVCWSPDSKCLALGQESDIKPEAAMELNGTVDLVIYNIETKEKKIIAKGTANYYYFPVTWEENGILSYKKIFFKNPANQEMTTYIKLDM